MVPKTDKRASGLAGTYADLFKGWRDRPVRVMEVGVEHGGLLWLWAELFPHPDSSFLGVDLRRPGPEVELPPNARVEVCNQNDAAGLARLAAEHGPFELIVDDGSHFSLETRATFAALFEHVRTPGGCYVIEDWAVGYWHDRADRDPRYHGMVEVVTDLITRAPALSIESFVTVLKPGQSFAAFAKGAQGWREYLTF
jgi:hypothetical protein